MDSRAQQVMDNLRRIVQALRLSSSQFERTSGLTAAQVMILRHIDASAGLSINDLAAQTLTHQSTVSEVVGKLEAKGLAIRSRAASDGRRRELQLTDAGSAILQNAGKTFSETLIQAVGALPDATLDGLSGGLASLIEAAGLQTATAPMFMEDPEAPKS